MIVLFRLARDYAYFPRLTVSYDCAPHGPIQKMNEIRTAISGLIWADAGTVDDSRFSSWSAIPLPTAQPQGLAGEGIAQPGARRIRLGQRQQSDILEAVPDVAPGALPSVPASTRKAMAHRTSSWTVGPTAGAKAVPRNPAVRARPTAFRGALSKLSNPWTEGWHHILRTLTGRRIRSP